ncbi:MAG: type II toxin-antitoxin system prevent-host-death family antitoxin [Cyanobacteria bacterium]|nr:type II toxin-antitoxin system prevent-host-death family antitoxin [Cyanobacteriota bacterium]
MRSVGAFEAKTHLAALLDAVSAGEQITITRHGHPVARLVPPTDQPPGSVAETIARLRQFNQGQSLGGVSLAELRDQGRRTGHRPPCTAQNATGVRMG